MSTNPALSSYEPFRSRLRHAVAECLGRHSRSVAQTGFDRWRFRVPGRRQYGTAEIRGDWLEVLAAMPGRRGRRAVECDHMGELLERNAALSGGARYALTPGDMAVFVRSDIPLGEHVRQAHALDERIAPALEGISAALATAGRRGKGSSHIDGGSADPDLPALCIEAGWECIERPSGALAVELEVDGGHAQASLESDPPALYLRLEAVPQHTAVAAGPCRYALGALLLMASAHLRMVRAAVSAGDAVPRFEVVLPAAPVAEELGHGLAALSVAHQLYAAEALALGSDAGLAETYLSMQGFQVAS